MITEGDRREAGSRRGIDGVNARALFDAIGVPMLIADDERRYVDANSAACAALGRPREDIVGTTVDDLTPPELRGELEVAWQKFLRTGAMSGVFRLVLPGGRMARFDYTAIAGVGDGRHLSVVVPSRRHSPSSPVKGPQPSPLSAREREIMKRVALGQDGPEIARDLVVSPATVRTHIGNAIRKLGARSRAHAIALALRGGLLDDAPVR